MMDSSSNNILLQVQHQEQIINTLNKQKEQSWYCYILRNRQSAYAHLTYNGSTNCPLRRLRQHNEEISGGARYTHGRGGGWEIYCLLTGFPDHKNALSCEWRMKHTLGKPGKRPPHHCGVKGRIVAMNDILQLDKWTQQCVHSNTDSQFTLYLAEDVVRYVQFDKLPSNVEFAGAIPDVMVKPT
jgi:predicted GIY-YIG superfamily endonuclease